MGGGEKHSPDVAKGPPLDLIAGLAVTPADATGAEAVGKQERSFCARAKSIEFSAQAGVGLEIGQVVGLTAGAPPLVTSLGQQVGTVAPEAERAMAGCLELGYEMSGVVESLDAAKTAGRLRVSGQLG